MRFIQMCLQVRALFVVCGLAVVLSGCGGGGGGGGGSTLGGSGLSMDTSPVTFTTEQKGNPPAAVSRSVTWTSNDVASVIVGVPPNQTLPYWLTVDLTGSSSPLNLTFSILTTDLSPGTYSQTIRVVTANSQNQVMDLVDVSVNFVVTAATTASPTSLSFAMVQGEAPAPQSIALSKAGVPVTPTSVNVTNGNTWFQASIVNNAVQISTTAAALTLTSGNQTGLVQIGHVNGIINIPLSLVITPHSLTVSSNPLYLINLTTQSTDLSKDITVGANFASAGNLPWNAAIEANRPWVAIGQISGDTSASNKITVSIDPTKIGNLSNRYPTDGSVINHTALVTITPVDPTVSPVTLTVTLNIQYPHITTVSPNVAVSGSSKQIILRGWDFSGITNQSLMCGNQAATAYTIMSNYEIRATCPSLPFGAYPLEFTNTLGMTRDNAMLYVEDPVTYAGEVIPTTGTKSRIIYDAVRKSIYMANTANQTLDRLVYDNTIQTGSKWVADNIAITSITDIALSTDGSYLYAGTDIYPGTYTTSSRLHEVNPSNLNVDMTYDTSGYRFNTLNFLSGGEALATFYGPQYDQLMRYKRNAGAGLVTPTLPNSIGGASRDGSRAVVASADAVPAGAVFYFNSSDAPAMLPISMTMTSLIRNAQSISSDRTGTKWVFSKTDVYNSNFILIGKLPVTTQASILSDDGTIAYTTDASGKLRKFNLSSVTAGSFAEIGGGTSFTSPPGNNPVMTLSHDGTRIFVAGDQNLLIMTAP